MFIYKIVMLNNKTLLAIESSTNAIFPALRKDERGILTGYNCGIFSNIRFYQKINIITRAQENELSIDKKISMK